MGAINLNLNSPLASAISSASGLIANVVNGLIVSPNGAPPGVSGFLFHIIDVEEMSVDSDVTDHFVEQNFAIQDHVSLKPIRFTLRGYMGELVDIVGVSSNPILSTILALAPLVQANPLFNTQDAQVYAGIALQSAQATNVINQIPSLFSLISNLSNVQTQQQEAYNFFLNMRNNRQLVTIQTPYGLLVNYIIENFRARQPGDSRFMSDFNVTFKQIQVVSTAVAPTAANPNPAGAGTNSANTSVVPAAPTPANPSSATIPVQQFSDNPVLPPFDDTDSGRLEDYTSPEVEQGQTAGTSTLPNTNPAQAVSVPNVFPTNSPIFQTMPLLNSPTPGFIPGP